MNCVKSWKNYGYQMYAPPKREQPLIHSVKNCHPITIPKHEPIKRAYVEMVRRVIENEAEKDEGSE